MHCTCEYMLLYRYTRFIPCVINCVWKLSDPYAQFLRRIRPHKIISWRTIAALHKTSITGLSQLASSVMTWQGLLHCSLKTLPQFINVYCLHASFQGDTASQLTRDRRKGQTSLEIVVNGISAFYSKSQRLIFYPLTVSTSQSICSFLFLCHRSFHSGGFI